MYNDLHHANGFGYYPLDEKESLKEYDQKINNSTKLLENNFDNIVEIRFLKEMGII